MTTDNAFSKSFCFFNFPQSIFKITTILACKFGFKSSVFCEGLADHGKFPWADLPVEIVEEGEKIKSKLDPTFHLTFIQLVGIHYACGVV